METEDKFKNSPIHDKRVILEMMDKLKPEEMVKVVDFIQKQVELYYHPVVMSDSSHSASNNEEWVYKDDCWRNPFCRIIETTSGNVIKNFGVTVYRT